MVKTTIILLSLITMNLQQSHAEHSESKEENGRSVQICLKKGEEKGW